MATAPVALFVYNRLEHTRRTISALQSNAEAAGTDLFVFSDAPRGPEAVDAVRDVRNFVSSVGGFRSTTVVLREHNFGLARSIIDGVTRLCNEYGRVIVLEDDLVTSRYFLEYMNAGLERYQDHERVMQVAGYMFTGRLHAEEDALLLPFISSWGWATWKRAWAHFDPQALGYARLKNDATLKRAFNLNGHYDYLRMLKSQQEGKVESWAIRWYLSVFMRQGLALYPRKTLVRNLGFDGSGVNCAVSDFDQDDVDEQFRVLSFPARIEISGNASDVYKNMPVAKLSLSSVRNRLAASMRRFIFGGRR